MQPPELNCAQTRAEIDDYFDHELTPVERAAVAAHLDRCAECARDFEQYTALLKSVAAIPRVDPPASLRHRVLSRVDRSSAKEAKARSSQAERAARRESTMGSGALWRRAAAVAFIALPFLYIEFRVLPEVNRVRESAAETHAQAEALESQLATWVSDNRGDQIELDEAVARLEKNLRVAQEELFRNLNAEKQRLAQLESEFAIAQDRLVGLDQSVLTLSKTVGHSQQDRDRLTAVVDRLRLELKEVTFSFDESLAIWQGLERELGPESPHSETTLERLNRSFQAVRRAQSDLFEPSVTQAKHTPRKRASRDQVGKRRLSPGALSRQGSKSLELATEPLGEYRLRFTKGDPLAVDRLFQLYESGNSVEKSIAYEQLLEIFDPHLESSPPAPEVGLKAVLRSSSSELEGEELEAEVVADLKRQWQQSSDSIYEY